MRIGHGYDVHRLVEDRKLIMGGVEIPYEKGLLGHSDADVLLHAVMDAVLGAAALGDIGQHFPDNDPAYKGADSLALTREVARIIAEHGYKVGNIDATILCQRPKLAPHIPAMRRNIADAFGLPVDAVSVKATTEEHLGFTGEGLGIAAHAVALIEGFCQPPGRGGTCPARGFAMCVRLRETCRPGMPGLYICSNAYFDPERGLRCPCCPTRCSMPF